MCVVISVFFGGLMLVLFRHYVTGDCVALHFQSAEVGRDFIQYRRQDVERGGMWVYEGYIADSRLAAFRKTLASAGKSVAEIEFTWLALSGMSIELALLTVSSRLPSRCLDGVGAVLLNLSRLEREGRRPDVSDSGGWPPFSRKGNG